MQRRIGVDLPGDYKELADKYPLLLIDKSLPVLHPATPEPPRNRYNIVNLISSAINHSRFVVDFEPTELITYTPGIEGGSSQVELLASESIPFPVYPENGGLLVWGLCENGSQCCWLTEGTPDDWTIFVASEPECWHYRGSITQFLVDILIRRVPCPAFPPDFPLGDDWQVEQIYD